MKSDILFGSEFVRIEHFIGDNNNTNLAFIFSSLESRSLDGNRNGGEIFFRNGYDVISFKISNGDWFQSLPPDIFEVIKSISLERGYQKKVAYGSSMGGFASIAFSRLLELDTAIVFSPQISISESFDQRWASNARGINFKYHITKETISDHCKFFIFGGFNHEVQL
ncbi:hypothetical protein ICN46_11210 [Polynucleobacter sp. Latsch14-2]|jgi:hypothetical protein|uniref:hypothetical protein n=1 Tax=Polynucleobacter sp. Latsch14-2 TaxID=2576920 RepID=UPI001C0AAA72|nr:hypothetical protein [Polynucleobacter sp. Latsch14-2]MBU3615458.1 hypothetical protein [Polynucleobacter sp. Latsch14-2]